MEGIAQGLAVGLSGVAKVGHPGLGVAAGGSMSPLAAAVRGDPGCDAFPS